MKLVQYKERIFVGLGCICLALGIIGAMLPVIPTVPFLFVAYFCFKNGSKRFRHWYENSKFHASYKKSVNWFFSMSMPKKILYVLGMIIFFTCLFYLWYYLYTNYFGLLIGFIKNLLSK